jgi:hypothetical protein
MFDAPFGESFSSSMVKVTVTLTKVDQDGNSAPRLLTLSFPGISNVPPLLESLQGGDYRTDSIRGGRIRFVAAISLVSPVEKHGMAFRKEETS